MIMLKNREQQELLGAMLDNWFSLFGPPHQLISDQETSLMGHEAGREMERFSIQRVPKETTSGAAGRQHTGTGLVERHIGLLQLTMAKLEAEADRQGFELGPHELAREGSMAHNQTLMAVFGMLPRPFYQEDGPFITAEEGALQTDVTPFEKALRIRQLALSTVPRSIAEDCIARANRTRTHQRRTGGLTRVDFHREVQGDVGWRGPAELLKLDKSEGTAIISYKGRPYLVSLRHIRPHQAGVFVAYGDRRSRDLLLSRPSTWAGSARSETVLSHGIEHLPALSILLSCGKGLLASNPCSRLVTSVVQVLGKESAPCILHRNPSGR